MTREEVKDQAEWISKFQFVQCPECETHFSSPILNRRLEDGGLFYCPLGHTMFFKTARENREQREREEKRKINEEEELYRMLHPTLENLPAPKKDKSFWGARK